MDGFNNKQLKLTVTCASGVEKVTKKELERLGYQNAPAVNGEISFIADKLAVSRCNINLRTANCVYINLKEFEATSFDQLFEEVKSINWGDYLPMDAEIVVDGKCVKSTLFAVSACQSIVKKAIVSAMCERYKLVRLPEDGSRYLIEFRIHKNTAQILLNTSGAGLHKRGYKDLVGIAPIKETLASAMVLLSDYYKNPFADPFCGSGTIAIEAAMIALNIAPSLNRKFDFNSWKNFDKNCFSLAVSEAKDRAELNREVEIFASDIDKKAIALAKRHAERAGVGDKIKFKISPVKDFCSNLSNGTIITNPPYGKRVFDMKEAEASYNDFGKAYKNLNNWSAFIITPAKNFEKHFGKKPDRVRKLYNSNIECKYFYYYKDKKV